MRPDISEFSYGYALTEELIHSSGLPIQAAPIFPSLIEEGKAGGGYDVQIPFVGVPLFLQFKLSDCMVRDTADEVRKGLLKTHFYRMHLRPMKHSKQHQLLLDLESRGKAVFYAAPHFHKPEELNDAYINRKVIDRSIFIRPSLIGSLPDSEGHHVSFKVGYPVYFCSEPRKLLEAYPSRKFFDHELLEGLEKRENFTGSAESVQSLASAMIESVRNITRKGVAAATEIAEEQDIDRLTNRSPRFQIAYLARAYFGCEIILVRKRDAEHA